ncbi:autophagy-related protein 33 [[Candida] anglica]|uniref:Autophagy-related protein 33 n=1 Tax=[Candida] anglica TaxID=148631 RepID=A0ABP0ELF3_9ASCO
MAGTCVATVKFVGVSSLGLLTASLSYQAFEAIPALINELNIHLTSLSQSNLLDQAAYLIQSTRLASLSLGTLASTLLSLAFVVSPPRGKHPYLIYASLGAPLAIASAFYQSYSHESRLLAKSKAAKKSGLRDQMLPVEETPSATTTTELPEEDNLGKSYIHVSDDSSHEEFEEGSSSSSTPSESEAPVVASVDKLQQALSIEEEVDIALSKKEFTSDLEKVQFGYYLGSAITGLGFAIATVGLIGDYYLL